MSPGTSKAVPVSELFNRLVSEYRNVAIPQAQLFQAALRVCAEDSKRSRGGEPPAPLGELVKQARAILDVPYLRLQPLVTTREVGTLRAAQPGPQIASQPSPPAAAAQPPAAPTPSSAPQVLPARSGDRQTDTSAAPFELRDEPAPADAASASAPVSFEDVFRHEAEPHGEPLPAEGRGVSFSVLRVGMVAVGVLAAAVAIVILWPGIRAGRSAATAVGVPGPASRRPTSAPTPLPTAVPSVAPVAPAAVPAVLPTAAPQPTAVPSTVPAATASTARAAAPAPRLSPARPAMVEGVETMWSPDWAGRAPTFVVHFASYRSRDNAVADAAKLGHELGRPAYALVVDLGDKGSWYRVVVGGFASAAEARAFRAQAAAAKTRDVGGVYWLAAP